MPRKIAQDDPQRVAFGRRLKLARIATGRTQAEVAALLGTTRTTVVDLESGRRFEAWPTWLAMVLRCGYDPTIVAPELTTAGLHRATPRRASTKSRQSDADLSTDETTEPVATSTLSGEDDPATHAD